MEEIKTHRHGTFSSSNMWKLMTNDRAKTGFGAPGLKYIKQTGYERLLGRAINTERTARPTSWGSLVQKRVFDLLPLGYRLVDQERLVHQRIPGWTGAPDLLTEDAVADTKCPYSMEVFCDKLEALKNIEIYKEEFPEDYWQHLSNAILLESAGIKLKYFEAIIYVPYRSELEEIRTMASQIDDPAEQREYYWIAQAMDEELPFIPEGAPFKNLNIFRFPLIDVDKWALIERVKKAGEKLIPL